MRRVLIHQGVTFNLVNQVNKFFLLLLDLTCQLLVVVFLLADNFLLGLLNNFINVGDFFSDCLNFSLESTNLRGVCETRFVLEPVLSEYTLHVLKLLFLISKFCELLLRLAEFVDILNERAEVCNWLSQRVSDGCKASVDFLRIFLSEFKQELPQVVLFLFNTVLQLFLKLSAVSLNKTLCFRVLNNSELAFPLLKFFKLGSD